LSKTPTLFLVFTGIPLFNRHCYRKKKRGKSYQTVIKCNWARTQPICYGGCWAEIVREGEGAIARVLGAGGGRPRGFAHGRQERRDFLLIFA